MPVLYFSDVRAELLPSHLDLEGTAGEEAFNALSTHFGNLARIAVDMEDEILEHYAEPLSGLSLSIIRKTQQNELTRYYGHVLSVATKMLDYNSITILSGAITLAAFVVSRGGDVDLSAKIFDRYRKIAEISLKTIEGDLDKIRPQLGDNPTFEECMQNDAFKQTHTTITRFHNAYTRGAVFATALVPVKGLPRKSMGLARNLHKWAIDELGENFTYSHENHDRLMFELVVLADESRVYRGTAALADAAYNKRVVDVAEEIKAWGNAGSDEACTLLEIQADLDATMLSHCYDWATTGEKAAELFHKHTQILCSYNPDRGQQYLRQLLGGCANSDYPRYSYDQGFPKLMAMLENLLCATEAKKLIRDTQHLHRGSALTHASMT